jgi:hypothetical protein
LHPTFAAETFTRMIEELCRQLNKHAAARFIGRAMLLLIWNRLMGMARRFTIIATRVRTGKLVVPVRQASVLAEEEPVEEVVRPWVAPGDRLPTHFRWLVNMLPEAEPFARDVVDLMLMLDVRKLIFEAPQLGRILRPLCKALGVEPLDEIRTQRPPPPPTTEVEYVPAPMQPLVESPFPDDGTGPLWTAEEEFWMRDENKWVHPNNRY